MTKRLEEIYRELKNDVLWLHARWKIYGQLYSTNPKHIDLLNQVSSTVFNLIQQLFIENIMLNLCRLIDPPITNNNIKKKNLCLRSLLVNLNEKRDGQLIQNLGKQLTELEKACLPIKRHRNKRLSHKDWNVGLKRVRGRLPGISRAKIEKALLELRKFLCLFEKYWRISSPAYENISISGGDGDTLINIIRKGIAKP